MAAPADSALADLARVLDALEIDWFLFGAQAAIIYGSTRVTADIDVTVDLADVSSRVLVDALVKRRTFALRVADTARFVERTRVLPIVHRKTGFPIDVVIAGPGLEEEFMARRTRRRRAGRTIPVARAEDIIVMKILAGRPHDVEDVRAILRAAAKPLDVAGIAKTLADLEQDMGQSDLVPMFERVQKEAARSRARTVSGGRGRRGR